VESGEPFGRLEQGAQARPAGLLGFEEHPALVDVDGDAGRADDRAPRVDDGLAATFEPVHTAVRPDDAMIEAPGDVARHTVVHGPDRPVTIFGMEEPSVHRHRAVEASGREAEEGFELFVPVDLALGEVPTPRSHPTRSEREAKPL